MANVTCSVQTIERKRGVAVYLRYRRIDGAQGKEKIGMLWKKTGKPPRGYLTAGMADIACRRKIVELEDEAPPTISAGVTFEQACKEFLRFVRDVRQIDEKTAADYQGVIEGRTTCSTSSGGTRPSRQSAPTTSTPTRKG